jgi:hypothetical protein
LVGPRYFTKYALCNEMPNWTVNIKMCDKSDLLACSLKT